MFKATTSLVAFFACALFMKFAAAAEAPTTAPAQWTPVWSDEFDGMSIDRTKWTFDTGNGGNGWGNHELEYYTDRPDNAYVKDGMLHIRAAKESLNGIDPDDVKKSYRFEQGFTFELNLSGVSDEARKAFVEKRDPTFTK